MKNFTMIIAISTMAFAGCSCGQGWRPNFLNRFHDRLYGNTNIGAPCDAGCAPIAAAPIAYAPPAVEGCSDCGPTVSNSYGGYETEYAGSYSSAPTSYGPSTTYQGGQTMQGGGESVLAQPR